MCVAFLCVCVCVCVCVCARVLWYLCCLVLLKESQGDISLNGVHKRLHTFLVCVRVGRWVFVWGRVIWKVTAGWVCLLFSVHLQPIKRQDWQTCSSSSAFSTSSSSSSTIPACVLLSFPPFSVSSLSSFTFLFLLPYSTEVDFSYWLWPSSDVNFLTTSNRCCYKVTNLKDIFFFILHTFSAKPKCCLLRI